jgi:hypothetical protein
MVGAVVVVVGLEPARKGVQAGLVAGVGPRVGPLQGEGGVEPLRLAVGLRPVGAGALVGDSDASQHLAEQPRAVAVAVVGEDLRNPDAELGVERQRLLGEAGHGRGALVGVDLQVGHPGVVVDRHMQVVVADPGPVASAGSSSQGLVATPSRDPALGLDVEVEQLPRPLALVAHHLPGWPVQLPQPGQLVAAQHRMDRGGCLTQRPANPVRPDPAGLPAGHDRPLPLGGQPPGTAMRP